MDTREIESFLKGKLGPYVHYKGVFTSDNLPFITYSIKPIIIIANTLDSQVDISVVGHWVAFYMSFHPKPYLLFFDSYGQSPHFYSCHFSSWLKLYSKFHVQEFSRQIQPEYSQKCGLYVIHFIHYTSYFGIDKYRLFFQNNFSSRKQFLNDILVTRYFFNRIMKKKNCIYWKKYKRNGNHAITYNECLLYKRCV